MSLCRCGKIRGRHHEVTDACLTPEDQAFVREFQAEYDRATRAKEDGPWWHQAAGRDLTAPAHSTERAPETEDARTSSSVSAPSSRASAGADDA